MSQNGGHFFFISQYVNCTPYLNKSVQCFKIFATNTAAKEVESCSHDDVIKWKHFPRYWPFVRGIYRSPVNSPHKGQWRGALMISLICAWTNGWVNSRYAGDLRCHRAHYDITVMLPTINKRHPIDHPLSYGTSIVSTQMRTSNDI